MSVLSLGGRNTYMSEDFEVIKLDTAPEIRSVRRSRHLCARMLESFVEMQIKWAAIKIPRDRKAGHIARGIKRVLKNPRYKDTVKLLGFDTKKGEVYLERLDH